MGLCVMRDFIIAHSLPSRNPTNKAKIPIGKIKIPTKKVIAISHAIHKQIIIIVIVIISSPGSPSWLKGSSKASPEST
jgi:hypothetical protein